jgi:hypothetical protein
VTDPDTGRRWVADATSMYTPTQLRAMSTEPDLIHQAARAIAAEAARDVEVYADAWVSLNGRPAERLIDPTVDLAHVRRDVWSDAWILPRADSVKPRNDAAVGCPGSVDGGGVIVTADQARQWVPPCRTRGDEFRMRNQLPQAGPGGTYDLARVGETAAEDLSGGPRRRLDAPSTLALRQQPRRSGSGLADAGGDAEAAQGAAGDGEARRRGGEVGVDLVAHREVAGAVLGERAGPPRDA